MNTDDEIELVEQFLFNNAPSADVRRAFASLKEKLQSYDAVLEQYAKQAKQNSDISDFNTALILEKYKTQAKT